MGNEDDTPPEQIVVSHLANRGLVRAICNLSLALNGIASRLYTLASEFSHERDPINAGRRDQFTETLRTAAAFIVSTSDEIDKGNNDV